MVVCRSWVIKNSFPHPHHHHHHDLLKMHLSMLRFPCLHNRPGSDRIRIALVHPERAIFLHEMLGVKIRQQETTHYFLNNLIAGGPEKTTSWGNLQQTGIRFGLLRLDRLGIKKMMVAKRSKIRVNIRWLLFDQKIESGWFDEFDVPNISKCILVWQDGYCKGSQWFLCLVWLVKIAQDLFLPRENWGRSPSNAPHPI